MGEIRTNRDLYLAIGELVARAPNRDLELYLRALLQECRIRRDVSVLRPADFIGILTDAFDTEPLPFDPAWAAHSASDTNAAVGFNGVETVLLRQIVDLYEMGEAGILARTFISLGVDAPRGGRWYNFTPRQYLECAAAGSIGGWEPGDDTGRQFVSGTVAVMNPDGTIGSADPRDVHGQWMTSMK